MIKTVLRGLWTCLKFPVKLLLKVANLIRKQVLGSRLLVKRGDVYYVPIWLPFSVAILLILPVIWDDIGDVTQRIADSVSVTLAQFLPYKSSEIADFFAPSVHHWANDMREWSDLYAVDIQLMATVMQIESCGHPSVVSSAGAQGLFQVMPFHFEDGEDMVDPDTNAKRGGLFLNYCYNESGGDIGLTLACYNGGPSVINRPLSTWADETQRYYRWGVGIYSDAIVDRRESDTLNQWMDAGGSRLCASAMTALRNYSSSIAGASS